VLAHNPEVTDLERRQAVEPDSSWRHVHLEMTKADDSVLKIELLRPRDWVVSHHAYAGTTIHLDLEEMGASGPARVVNIGRAPPLANGSGQVVTGTFSHSAGNVINLYIDGLEQPIGTTDNHPFWSEDRREFVPAGELQNGENLRTLSGRLATVTGTRARTAFVAVHNLEVNQEHVYHVTGEGILTHNQYLTRFGNGPETLETLAEKAAQANAAGFPHGVSTRLSSRMDGRHRNALLSEVEEVFPVTQTGSKLSHHTVELPEPVTPQIVDQFNELFEPLFGL